MVKKPRIDLSLYVGKKYGKLLILSEAGKDKNNTKLVNTLCDCGRESICKLYSVRSGKRKSCGCSQNKTIKNKDHTLLDKEMIGKRFGKLVVKSKTDIRKSHCLTYECLCDCGKVAYISGANLRKEKGTKSCGCLTKTTTNYEYILKQYKASAKRRNINWELSNDQFKVLTQKVCNYCGTQPLQKAEFNCYSDVYLYNGIDRVDSKLGYSLDNCVACCKYCNYAKFTHTHEEFKQWIIKAFQHIQSSQVVSR